MILLRITDENFIEQLKLRNEKSLEYVIDNYAWILKTVIKKHLFYLMDYYDECMNDCLLAIWDNIHLYNPEKSSFKNWIGGIARYKSIDYTRKYLKDMKIENVDDINISTKDNSLKRILENELREELEKLLQNLSTEDQIIFKKKYFEDMTMDEISEDTGLSKPVLYNRVSRGKKKIKDEVDKEGGLENEGYK